MYYSTTKVENDANRPYCFQQYMVRLYRKKKEKERKIKQDKDSNAEKRKVGNHTGQFYHEFFLSRERGRDTKKETKKRNKDKARQGQ